MAPNVIYIKLTTILQGGYSRSVPIFMYLPLDAPPSLLVAMNATLHRDVLRSAMETPSVEVTAMYFCV